MKLFTVALLFLTLSLVARAADISQSENISRVFKASEGVLPPANGSILVATFGVPDRNTSLFVFKQYSGLNVNQSFPLNTDINYGNLIIQYAGKRRGIDIFRVLSKDSLKQELTFTLNYGANYLNNQTQKFKDAELFSDLVNYADIKYFKRNEHISSKSNPRLLAEDWYDPTKNYVEIETSRDGIAIVNTNDILKYLSDLKGKSADHLILYWNGNPYPYYFSSQSGIIDNNIDIYFFGRRGIGDTTYYSHYDPNSEFYFTYDESIVAPKLTAMSQVNGATELKSVNYSKHIERDVYYSFGSIYLRNYNWTEAKYSNFLDSRTVMGEGWFWDVIDPKNSTLPVRDTFKVQQFIALSDEPGDNLQLKIAYHGIQDSINSPGFPIPDVETRYRINFEWNNLYADSVLFANYKGGDIKVNLNFMNTINGMNEIYIRSLEYSSATDKSSCGIDYFTLIGKAKPWANRGLESFGINADGASHFVNVPGFSSSDIFVLDTINGSFGKVAGNRGFAYLLGAINDTIGAVSVVVDDSAFYSKQRGLFIIKKKSFQFEAKYFADGGTEAINYLNAIESGSFIGVLINSGISVSQDFKTAVKSLGAEANFSSSDAWSFCTVKGSPLHGEKNVTAASANLSGFFEDQNGSSYSAKVDFDGSQDHFVFMNDANSIDKVNIIPVGTSNLRSTDNQADAIFIYNSAFKKSATDYVNYRKSKSDKNIIMVDVNDIYKEFGYGKKSPHSIKKFLKYAYNSWQKPALTHLVLFGDANEYPNNNVDKTVSKNYIPTYGVPASDFWYGQLEGDDDFEPEFIVGRIPIDNDNDGAIYLNNMSSFENNAVQSWQKNYFFMVGGYDQNQVNAWYNTFYYRFEDILKPSPYCANVIGLKKTSSDIGSITQAGEIRQKINDGDLFTTYIGHASSEIFDMDGWEVDYLNNKNRTGILMTLACNTGAFAIYNLQKSRNERYILTKDKGFIIALGSSTTGFLDEQVYLTTAMFKSMVDEPNKLRNLGEAVYFGKNTLSNYYSSLYTKQQFSILGDPLYNVPVPKNSDLFLSKDNIQIKADTGNELITEDNDKMMINGKVYNNGYCACEPLRLRCIRTYKAVSDTSYYNYSSVCKLDSFHIELTVKNKPGRHDLVLTIDPDERITDDNPANNVFATSVNVFQRTLLPLEPLAYNDVKASKPFFRVVNPFGSGTGLVYHFSIIDKMNNIVVKDSSNAGDNKITTGVYSIDWEPSVTLTDGTNYTFTAGYYDNAKGSESSVLKVPFNAKNDGMGLSRAFWNANDSASLASMVMDGAMVESRNGTFNITPLRKEFNYDAFGLVGHDSVWSYAAITVGDEVFVSERYHQGFNVAVLKSSLDDNTSSLHYYETWGYGFEESEWKKNNVSINLVDFLKDSVKDDDYVFVVTSQSSFRMPILYQEYADTDYLKRGTMDSLKDAMVALGSNVFDTLNLTFADIVYGGNFAMRGWRGITQNDIEENWNYNLDTARITGEISRYKEMSGFSTPEIGPSLRWNELSIAGSLDNDNLITYIEISGIDKKGDTTEIMVDTNKLNVDISKIDAGVYPYLILHFKFERKSMSIAKIKKENYVGISSIKVDYMPAPEVALDAQNTKLIQDNVLRGDPAIITLSAVNLSMRSPASALKSLIQVKTSTFDINDTTAFPTIEPNTTGSANFVMETDLLDPLNTININYNPNHDIPELYYFNNTGSQLIHIANDTVASTSELYADSVKIRNNDYISKTPTIEVRVYDNSLVAITDSSKIKVRLNGLMYPYDWEKNKCEFISYGKNPGLKAVLRFKTDTLIYEDNLFIVYTQDAAGNRDTSEIYARVSLKNSFIDTISVYPNPAFEDINLGFYFRSPYSNGVAKFNIYDIRGNKVAAIESKVNVGWNYVRCPLENSDGNSLASGVYYFMLNVDGNFYVDPKFGKFIIAN